MFKLLVIDNYDSFTYNLVQMFMHYELQIHVHRSDRITMDQAYSLSPDYILISPGPGKPSDSGISIPLIDSFSKKVPILGVCLGMQCINEAFGGSTVRAPVPVHGKTSSIRHDNYGPFLGLPSPFRAARYHSLVVAPDRNGPLIITSRSEEGVIMGISHRDFPLHGIQFHPESFMTEYGIMIIENFLKDGPMGKDDSDHD
ncbi:MAG: aminodeoxychorismate/anthranilate synthase component II [Deltaproteobacteria bacterium]|nr:aminodeoxychorismate/anthranilate synthase component II [Deltaproteobacteria bacterium]